MISSNSLKIPFTNPEVYLNLLRIVCMKEFGSIRPIAFRSDEGDSTVISADDVAFTTTDAFINALTDAYYAGDEFEGVVVATLTNKSEYSLNDLAFSKPVHVEGNTPIMTVASKCDFTVYFRYGVGHYTSQENANFLATYVSRNEMKGIVPFASNHTIVNEFTFEERNGEYLVRLDTKDNTVLQDALEKLQKNVNSIKIV